MNNLAVSYQATGRTSEAIPLLAEKKLERDPEAAVLLQEAEALLAEPLEGRSLGSWWNEESRERALKKARELIRQPAER